MLLLPLCRSRHSPLLFLRFEVPQRTTAIKPVLWSIEVANLIETKFLFEEIIHCNIQHDYSACAPIKKRNVAVNLQRNCKPSALSVRVLCSTCPSAYLPHLF